MSLIVNLQVDGLHEETLEMLGLPPDRIGHGTFIHPDFGGSDALLKKTVNEGIPLGMMWPEPCTVNVQTDLVQSTFELVLLRHAILSNIEHRKVIFP